MAESGVQQFDAVLFQQLEDLGVADDRGRPATDAEMGPGIDVRMVAR